jgi:hypothetical protein
MDLLEYLVVISCSPKQGWNKKPARNNPPRDPSKTGNQ